MTLLGKRVAPRGEVVELYMDGVLGAADVALYGRGSPVLSDKASAVCIQACTQSVHMISNSGLSTSNLMHKGYEYIAL